MTLRARFLVYLGGLHLLLAVLAYRLIEEHPWWLFAFELVFVLSFAVVVILSRAFSVPEHLLATGTELLEEGDFTSRFTTAGHSEMDRLLEVYNAMADRLRDERLRVRERNELLDLLLEASPGGMVVHDLDGRLEQVNPSAARLFGLPVDALVGRCYGEISMPLAAALETLGEGETRIAALPDGRRVRLRHAIFRERGFARRFDLLEELTDELRRSEKTAYEKLVRMMAHEVNNSLAAVGSLLASLRGLGERLPETEGGAVDHALVVAGERVEHLGAFMKSFADVVRLPPPERRGRDLDRLLDDLETLWRPLLEERRIELVREASALDADPRNGGERLGQVEIDTNQIELVLGNVLTNAAEAIGEDGTVILRSGRSGQRRWIEIEDDGGGLPAEIRDQLFTPFFSTKDDGRGLGLMVVKEVLTRHGFAFALKDSGRGGTRFRMEI